MLALLNYNARVRALCNHVHMIHVMQMRTQGRVRLVLTDRDLMLS